MRSTALPCPNAIYAFSITALVVVISGCSEKAVDAEKSNTQVVENKTASQPPSKSKDRFADLISEFEEMKEVLKLDESEKANLTSVHEKYLLSLNEWHDENWPDVNEIQSEAMEAFRKKDLRRLKKMDASGAKKKVTELFNKGRDMLREYDVEVFKAIPESKRLAWQAHVVSKQLLEFLEPITLDQEQVEVVRSKATDAIAQIRGKNKDNWRGYGTSGLEKVFEAQILKPEQRDAFEKLKDDNKLRMLKWSNNP